MSQDNLKEMEIITQRIDDGLDQQEKINGNPPVSDQAQINDNGDYQSDQEVADEDVNQKQTTHQPQPQQDEVENNNNNENQENQNGGTNKEITAKKTISNFGDTNNAVSEKNIQNTNEDLQLTPKNQQQQQQQQQQEPIQEQDNKQQGGEINVQNQETAQENGHQNGVQQQSEIKEKEPLKVQINKEPEPKSETKNQLSPLKSNLKKTNVDNLPQQGYDQVNENGPQIQINGLRQSSSSGNSNRSDPQGKKMSQHQDSARGNEQHQEEKGLFDDDDDDVKKSKFPQLEKLIESNMYQTFITILTIYALFGDDIRVMATTKSADNYFDVFTIITLIVFTIEILLCTLCKPGYVLSFFFWLDFISTVSLIIDIQMISNEIFYGGSSTSVNASQIAQAGKASRVGTKAGRVVRLVRLIRIVKLYKLSQEQVEIQNTQQQKILEKRQKKKQPRQSRFMGQFKHNSNNQINFNYGNSLQPGNPSQVSNSNQTPAAMKRGSVQSPNGTKRESVVQVDKPPESIIKESRVSRRLSDLTTRRVIVIVLTLLFIMPLFTADYYFDLPSSMDFAVDQFKSISLFSGATQADIKNLFDEIIDINKDKDDGVASPVALFSTPFPSFIENYQKDNYDELRVDEQLNFSEDIDADLFESRHLANSADFPDFQEIVDTLKVRKANDEAKVQGIANQRPINILSAGLSFGRTIFVCICLTCGALYFTKDANDLALRPIERLIDKVNQIAKNPISAKEQKLVQEENGDTQLETIIIENAIIKIGVLLALGFGDAGSEIIGSNMQKSGDVDPMIPGMKKCAIYGFCDIRNFTDATEVLQEDVMIFVNNIGEVVHSMTDRYQGAANKNIGDAFLLVWKIPFSKYSIQDETNEISFSDQEYISRLADMAMLSFMKIQVKLNREPKILRYREDKRLQSRMANYKVRLGYGLHIGWGIEGAIGSEFKIDASYLSPNVNMAARLEAATKQFGTPILISSALQCLFTPPMKEITRYIDRVTVKGSNQPIGLYTVDQELENLPISKDPEVAYEGLSKSDRSQIERQKKKEIQNYLENMQDWEWDCFQHMQENKDIRLAAGNRDPNFYNNFTEAFQHYLDGDWGQAKQKFDICKKIKPNDGPLLSLLDVMQETNFKAPQGWPGYRVLTEK